MQTQLFDLLKDDNEIKLFSFNENTFDSILTTDHDERDLRIIIDKNRKSIQLIVNIKGYNNIDSCTKKERSYSTLFQDRFFKSHEENINTLHKENVKKALEFYLDELEYNSNLFSYFINNLTSRLISIIY